MRLEQRKGKEKTPLSATLQLFVNSFLDMKLSWGESGLMSMKWCSSFSGLSCGPAYSDQGPSSAEDNPEYCAQTKEMDTL
ncbi:hypothetical protein NQZ68_041951 [Dissostichus eleginoides]|nr:hypothetical protein NQZ68_041951 [Dissostichus eleginoides]